MTFLFKQVETAKTHIKRHFSVVIKDVEEEAVEAFLFLWKRKQKREKSTASAST